MSMCKKFRRFSIVGAIIIVLSIISVCKLHRNNVQANVNKEVVYTVKEGDCLYSIADKFKGEFEITENVISRIRFRNKIGKTVFLGQKLYIEVK